MPKKIDINKGSREELVENLGISTEVADRILRYRKFKPFTNSRELRKIPGIPSKDIATVLENAEVVPAEEVADTLPQESQITDLTARVIDHVDRFGKVVLSIPLSEAGREEIPRLVAQLNMAVEGILRNTPEDLPPWRIELAESLLLQAEADLDVFTAATSLYVTGGLAGRSDYAALMSAPMDADQWAMIAQSANPIRELSALYLTRSGPTSGPLFQQAGIGLSRTKGGEQDGGTQIQRSPGEGSSPEISSSQANSRLRRLLEIMKDNKTRIAALLRTLATVLDKEYVKWIAHVLEAFNDRGRYAGESGGSTATCYTEVWLTDISVSQGTVGDDWTFRFNVGGELIDIVFKDDTDLNSLQHQPREIKSYWESGLCGQENSVNVAFWAIERDAGWNDIGSGANDSVAFKQHCPGTEEKVLNSLVSETGETSTTVSATIMVIKTCGSDEITAV